MNLAAHAMMLLTFTPLTFALYHSDGRGETEAVSRHRYELEKGAQVPSRTDRHTDRADGGWTGGRLCQISDLCYAFKNTLGPEDQKQLFFPSISGSFLKQK